MSQVICSSCFEVGDTTKRFIELPYICDLCEKDSALAIEQDVWEAEYVGPACWENLNRALFPICPKGAIDRNFPRT